MNEKKYFERICWPLAHRCLGQDLWVNNVEWNSLTLPPSFPPSPLNLLTFHFGFTTTQVNHFLPCLFRKLCHRFNKKRKWLFVSFLLSSLLNLLFLINEIFIILIWLFLFLPSISLSMSIWLCFILFLVYLFLCHDTSNIFVLFSFF